MVALVQPVLAGMCHGVCVDEDLWDAYDRMGLSFQQHAADSAANAHYDRPAVLAALGLVGLVMRRRRFRRASHGETGQPRGEATRLSSN